MTSSSLASEGSFGPHPSLLVVPAASELLVFVDDELDLVAAERLVSIETNFSHAVADRAESALAFSADRMSASRRHWQTLRATPEPGHQQELAEPTSRSCVASLGKWGGRGPIGQRKRCRQAGSR